VIPGQAQPALRDAAPETTDCVLVVNDAPDQLMFTADLLRDAGYCVTTAADGIAAFEIARLENPSVIISDVVMPRMDGLELCRRVRATAQLKLTPVLLVSGLATDSESAVAGLKAGADDYLEIPFDPMRLVSKVTRLIERKRAEDLRRRQLDFTEAITTSLGEGVCAFDANRRITFVNPAAAAALDCTQAELLGRDVHDAVGPRQADGKPQPPETCQLNAVLARGETVRVENDRFTRRDGSTFPVSYTSSPIRTGGQTVGAVLAFHDITDRAAADDRLRRQQAALVEAQRLAQVGSWAWTRESDTTTWSDETFRIFGRDPSAGAPSFADHASLCSRNGADLSRAVEHSLSTGAPFKVEVEIRRPAGDTRWLIIRGAVLRGEDGSIAGMFGTAQDITDARRQREMLERANERLEQSERRYRDLVENLNDVVFSIDGEGRLTYVSPSVQRFGYTPDQLIGKRFSDLAHPDDLAGLEQAFAGSHTAAEPFEFRALDRDGAVHRVRVSSRAVFDAGRLVGVTGVVMDITAQRRAEDQLRAAQRLEAVGRLAGGIAHDFNNLLVAINGYAEFAIEAVREGDPMRKDLEEILRAGNRAAALTRQLLAFSRKQVLKPEIINLNDIISGMEGMLRRLIGEDIEVQTRRADGLGRVLADPGQMEQVIMNLVVNARDAMPTGGKLIVSTFNETAADGGGDRVVLSVQDTGSGMDDQTKAQIFEPFFSTKGPGEGTGLGLSTVHGIVAQSGGTISVETAPGQGTTFTIAFPRASAGPSGVVRAPRPQRASGRETVLLVEDEPAVRQLAKRFLASSGYQVLVAENGGEALLTCENHQGTIDLLLTDVVMPQMSGRALWDRLVKLRPGLRVLFMSGYSGTAIAHHGVLDEGAHLIQKPFSAADLSRRVREVLEDRSEPS
jgi:PAS domain S-box-containing protein